MATSLSRTQKDELEIGELVNLRDALVEEKHRLESLLKRVNNALGRVQERTASQGGDGNEGVPPPRSSPMDQWKNVIEATKDLRVGNGNLSAERVAKVFGVSLSQLAKWLGRTKQAVSKTPDADSLQNALSYFERVARIRLVTESDADFRKWLRMPHELLKNKSPLDLLANGDWQPLADYVDDALTGATT